MAEADPLKVFDVSETEIRLSRLLDRAKAGEEIILAKAGTPYAKLVPIDPPAARAPRKPGRFRGLLGDIPDSVWFDPLPDDELDAWEGKYSNII